MRRRILIFGLMLVIVGCVSTGQAEPETEPETDEQKTLYALGYALSTRIGGAEFTAEEVALIKSGFGDGLMGGDAKVDMPTFGPKIQALVQARAAAGAEKEKKASGAYVEAMAKTEGAQTTASGAIYIEVEAGAGPNPGPTDTVTLHYHGTLRDGSVFDSSVDKGTPATFRLNGVVPCFGEGVQMMKVGGKAKLVCPSDTAYGDQGSPPAIKPGAALTFEVELLEIQGAAPSGSPVP